MWCRFDVTNEDGTTPLHKADSGGYKEVTKLLIESGAEVDVADGNGRTPLHFAVCLSEVGQLLIENCADIFKADNDGITPR